jgi:hypothetical protein
MKLQSFVIGALMSACALVAQAQSEPSVAPAAPATAAAKKPHAKAHKKHVHKVAAKKHHKGKSKAKKAASM